MISTGYIDHSHTEQQTKIEISGLTCRTKCRKRILVLRRVYRRAGGLGGKEGLVPQKCWQSGATPNDVINPGNFARVPDQPSIATTCQPTFPSREQNPFRTYH